MDMVTVALCSWAAVTGPAEYMVNLGTSCFEEGGEREGEVGDEQVEHDEPKPSHVLPSSPRQ